MSCDHSRRPPHIPVLPPLAFGADTTSSFWRLLRDREGKRSAQRHAAGGCPVSVSALGPVSCVDLGQGFLSGRRGGEERRPSLGPSQDGCCEVDCPGKKVRMWGGGGSTWEVFKRRGPPAGLQALAPGQGGSHVSAALLFLAGSWDIMTASILETLFKAGEIARFGGKNTTTSSNFISTHGNYSNRDL